MRVCVNTIKWLIGFLIVVFILAYCISLNIENHFIIVNSKWISNDFLFAVSGGAFASLLIVLALEVLKYFQFRKDTEDRLFSYFMNLYDSVLQTRTACKRAIDGSYSITGGMLRQTTDNAILNLNAINYLDYTSFCKKKNRISKLLVCFRQEKYFPIKNTLVDFLFFHLAVQEDQIDLLQQGKTDNVTCNSTNTNKALKKILCQSGDLLTLIDQFLSNIDNELGNRYNWKSIKQTMNTCQANYTSKSLKDYLIE